MIISTNREPSLQEFEDLCNQMCAALNHRAQEEPEYYLSKGAQKLETEVKKAFDEVAIGTNFENTIEIISGQRFPDIVAAKYYGVEVKSTKDDKWTMIGGSVAEGTRIEDVEHIFLLFGKLHKPIEFKTRRYEACLCDIAVTHSPRYKIDMNLAEGKTIFDNMKTSYDELRKMNSPIDFVVDYFRTTLKPGESLWWVNGEDATHGESPAKIRMWKTLSKEEKENIIAEGFALFPELFSDNHNKYERFSLWLASNHGVISSSLRDPFSAGGQSDLEINGTYYKRLPRKYIQLFLCKNKVLDMIKTVDETILSSTWGKQILTNNDRMNMWMELVSNHAQKEPFDVATLLNNLFKEQT